MAYKWGVVLITNLLQYIPPWDTILQLPSTGFSLPPSPPIPVNVQDSNLRIEAEVG